MSKKEKKWDKVSVCFLCGREMTDDDMNDCRSADLDYGGYTHNGCWNLMIKYTKWRKEQGDPLFSHEEKEQIGLLEGELKSLKMELATTKLARDNGMHASAKWRAMYEALLEAFRAMNGYDTKGW
jgi:hypothetical protein